MHVAHNLLQICQMKVGNKKELIFCDGLQLLKNRLECLGLDFCVCEIQK